MEYNTIKAHPPWFARGTPVINSRDGPQMAISDKPLFAIREGPSARGNPTDIFRLWLTLKTVFFNTQNHVFSLWSALLGSKLVVFDADRACPDSSGSEDAVRSGEAVVDFDLSACNAPDNVKMLKDNVKKWKTNFINSKVELYGI